MKKIVCFCICVTLMLTFVGCGGNKKTAKGVNDGHKKTTSQSSNTTSSASSQSTASGQTTSTNGQTTNSAPVSTSPPFKPKTSTDVQKPDIDLSGVTSNIAYSKVAEISGNYSGYLGKVIRLKGIFDFEKGKTRSYYYCLLSDPTACCSAGLEFILKDTSYAFPNDYPTKNQEFVIQGTLNSYKEGENTYLELKDASFIG